MIQYYKIHSKDPLVAALIRLTVFNPGIRFMVQIEITTFEKFKAFMI